MKTNIQFANDGAHGVTRPTLIGFVNEISIGDDGWAEIAPFGDHPSEGLVQMPDGRLKRIKAIQRIKQENAERMVAQFHNSRKGIRKFFRGCNIYDGHPDVPGLGDKYPDKEPKGVFADMVIRGDRIFGLPIFTNEGSEVVETKKRRAFSGRLVEAVPDGT